MLNSPVSKYLQQARNVAAEADTKSGAEKQRLLAVAYGWMKLAEQAAAEASVAILQTKTS